jgi:hypothetical protein
MASAIGRCSSTRASWARKAEQLSGLACCLRREGEAGEAIGRTAEDPTPTGRPQRNGKDARQRGSTRIVLPTKLGR